jgi:phage terminase small subunit
MQHRNKPVPEDWTTLPTKLPESNLQGEAGREWDRIGRYLVAIDRVTELDRQSLVHYCVQWANFSRTVRELDGFLTADGPSHEIAHPLIAPAIRYGKATIKIACQFGLTARTRDLESDHGNRMSKTVKKLLGNQAKVGAHHLESPTALVMPDWDEDDIAPFPWLSERSRLEYLRLRDSLRAADLFCPLDVVPITVTCVLFDLYCSCYEQITSMTVPVHGKDGEIVREVEHPLHKSMCDLSEVLIYVWKDYGQTPRFRKVFSGESKRTQEYDVPILPFKTA